jgi:hypothetical protein
MLLELFQTTTMNIKQMQDTHGMRLADNWCDNRTQSDASGLVWRVLFRLFIVVSMLLEKVQTTTVNTKQIQITHGMRLADNWWHDRFFWSKLVTWAGPSNNEFTLKKTFREDGARSDFYFWSKLVTLWQHLLNKESCGVDVRTGCPILSQDVFQK